MAKDKLNSYLVYESWVTAGRMLDKEVWHDLRDRIDDYALYGIENYEGLTPENKKFLEMVFKQVRGNKNRYYEMVENGSKSPGAPPKSDYALVREMLEFGLSGAEVARYYGVNNNTITEGAIYVQWKADGKPTPNKPVKKGRPTAKDFCEWKGIPYSPENVNNQELISDEIDFLDENGKWNF